MKKVLLIAGVAAVLLTGCLGSPPEPEETFGTLTVRDYFEGAVEVFEPVLFRQFPGMDSTYLIAGLAGKITVVTWRDDAWQMSDFENVPVLYGEDGGLLGFAFHPDYATNRKYYVYYVEGRFPGTIVLAEREADSTLVKGSGKAERRLLTLEKPYVWHNGGTLIFGPEGYLYTAIGDGGGMVLPETKERAQNPSVLFGKFIRIDVDGPDAFPDDPTRNYAIPPGNPFVDSAQYLPEIWAKGLRSPWKWTFHPLTGEIWLGDVGQSLHEEITLVPRGANLGWPIWEGTACVNQHDYERRLQVSGCTTEGFLPPVLSLPRKRSASVTGGIFYPETPSSPFSGSYIFGDFVTGKVWALRTPDGFSQDYVEVAHVPSVVSFDLDEQGRLFATSLRSRKIYILEPSVSLAGTTEP